MLEVYVILRLHHSLITIAVRMVLTRLGELRWQLDTEEKNDPSSVRPSSQNSPETWGDITMLRLPALIRLAGDRLTLR